MLPQEFLYQQRKCFLYEVKHYLWEDPFLYKICGDGLIRRCVPEIEMLEILSHCHDSAYGGHFGATKTAAKAMESGFFWPTLFKDAKEYVDHCDRCQRQGNVSKRNEMPLTSIQEVEIFDVWGLNFMGLFPSSFGNQYVCLNGWKSFIHLQMMLNW